MQYHITPHFETIQRTFPKNYGKAMLAYIQKNTHQAKSLLSELDVDFMEFMMIVKNFKSKIYLFLARIIKKIDCMYVLRNENR